MESLSVPALEAQPQGMPLPAGQSAQVDGLVAVLMAMLRAAPVPKQAASQVTAGLLAIQQAALSSNTSSQIAAPSAGWLISQEQSSGDVYVLYLTKTSQPPQQLYFQLEQSGNFFGDFSWFSGGDSLEDIAIFEMLREGAGWTLVKKDLEEAHPANRLPLGEPPGGLPWSVSSFQTILDDLFKDIPEIFIQDLFSQPKEPMVEVVTPPSEPAHCGQCGALLRPKAKFCQQCGAPQHSPPAVAPGTTPERIPVFDASVSVSSGQDEQPAGLCPRCGDPIGPKERYCNQCGLPLTPTALVGEIICQQCGHPNRPRSKFCKHCGARLASG